MGSRTSHLHAGLFAAFALMAPTVLIPGASAEPWVQLAQSTSSELDDWNAIKTSKKADDYQNYLNKYPNGAFADLAKLRIKQYAPPPAPAAAAPAVDLQQAELSDWKAIRNSKSVDDFESFLKKHPDSDFAEVAKQRIKDLTPVPAAASAPAAAPSSPPAAVPAAAPSAPAPVAAMPSFDSASLQLFAKSGARLRASPDKNAPVLSKLATNTEINVTGRSQDGAWLRVAMATGGTGYLAAGAAGEKPVTISAAPAKPKNTAKAAPAAPLGPDEDVCKLDSAAAPNDRAAACERLVAKASSDADKLTALNNFAAALDVAQRYDDSVRKYEQAAALSPRDATIYYRLGLVRLDQNRFPEARQAFDKAAMLDSKNNDYIYERGVAAAGFGDFAKARDEVKRALLTKDSMQYYQTLGEYQLALGDLDSVKTALERGRKIEPNASSLTLAVLDYYTGNLDLALPEAAKAANSGESPYAPIWQAVVQKAKGDAAGATQTLETARGVLGNDWPAPIYDYLLGKIPESKMATSAKTTDRTAFAERLCIAKFFAGEWTFLSGDTDGARAALQDATGTQAFYRLEFAAAKGRLAHMTK
jgi:lipoprotein NlpI